ncbi:MAG: polysaccharide deacetylase family protein [Candidatus Aminicenantes bacterium]
MKKLSLIFMCVLAAGFLWISCGPRLEISPQPIQLIVRGDDMGMTHACNLAVARSFREGVLTCASIMVPSPWFEEAARMCREHPQWCIGVHLTLTGEWRDYRWRPVLPVTEVSSLVDEDGYFYQTTEAFLAARPDLQEVEKELRAQMDLALKRKIDVQYIDTHMWTARATLQLHSVVAQISQDYRVPLSQDSGEEVLNIYEVPAQEKEDALAETLKQIGPGFYLLVVHPGLDTPEERALEDFNPQGLSNVASHRAAVTRALTSQRIKKIIRKRGIQLTDYRPLRQQMRSSSGGQ